MRAEGDPRTKYLLQQLGSLFGALFAAACCPGLPVLLSALSAAGLGCLTRDEAPIPLMITFVALNLWLLWHAAGCHAKRRPLWLGVAGGVLAVVGLYIHPLATTPGLPMLVASQRLGFFQRTASAALRALTTPQCRRTIDRRLA